MDYTELTVQLTDPSFGEILEAELAELDFESFESQGNIFKAYIPVDQYRAEDSEEILNAYSDHISSKHVQVIEHTNWNAVWESNYPPVTLEGELFIGAPFHEVPQHINHHIILEPNMSFGTGHHPTTELMLRQLFTLDLNGKSLIDFGCGSAVLAIYAAMKGAHGSGVEIDAHAAEAARANLDRNNTTGIDILTGGIERLKGHTFDIIAANINRNVIEECLPQFRASVKNGGWLLCSGFLTDDTFALKERLSEHGFKVEQELQKDGWAMLAAKSLI